MMIHVYLTMVHLTFPRPNSPLRNASDSAPVGDSLTLQLVRVSFLLPHLHPCILTFTDVHRGSLSLFHPPGLFEVQTTAVSVMERSLGYFTDSLTKQLLGMFLRGTAFDPVAWLFISVGLRKAQDVGAHRRKIYGDKPSIEGELWKRAFWALVLQDRTASVALGRPCCSGEEE